VNFSRIPVGSTLEGLFIEVWHGGIIEHRSYMSRKKHVLVCECSGYSGNAMMN
jgi:hypothetical protein